MMIIIIIARCQVSKALTVNEWNLVNEFSFNSLFQLWIERHKTNKTFNLSFIKLEACWSSHLVLWVFSAHIHRLSHHIKKEIGNWRCKHSNVHSIHKMCNGWKQTWKWNKREIKKNEETSITQKMCILDTVYWYRIFINFWEYWSLLELKYTLFFLKALFNNFSL